MNFVVVEILRLPLTSLLQIPGVQLRHHVVVEGRDRAHGLAGALFKFEGRTVVHDADESLVVDGVE